MSYSIKGGDGKATRDLIRRGQDVLPVLVKKNGLITANPTEFHTIHRMADLMEIGNPSFTREGERTHFEVGKDHLTVFDRVSVSFSVTMEGDATSLFEVVGDNPRGVVNAHQMGGDYSSAFHLALISSNTDKDVTKVDVYPDMSLRWTEAPGAVDGEVTYSAEIFAENARAYSIPGGVIAPAFEAWYDNGSSITNAAAPDGALITTFTLGTGNNAYGSATTPVAVVLDPNATGIAQYFFFVRVNGADMDDSQVSFNPSTSTLTFTTAPADGAILEVGYLVDTSVQAPPHWNGGQYGAKKDWKNVL